MSSPPEPTSAEAEDFAWMARVALDDENAFRALVEKYQQVILNYFTRMGASTAGEDLAQDTFIRLWNYRKKYKPSAKFTTFLYTLARHVWLDSVRRRIRFRLFSDRYREEIPSSTDGGMRTLRKHMDIQTALERLPLKHREVLVLAITQGLKYEEIASVLSIPIGTVKSRVFHALATLKALYHDEPPA